MRKLKLDPESLRVQSFASAPATPPRGTVAAHSYVTDIVNACSEQASQYCMETDYHWHTCGNSCINMCFETGPAC